MANKILIKHGSSTPSISNLSQYELGYSVSDGLLYINDAGIIKKINEYILSIASATVLGGIKVGEEFSISSNGVLSINSFTKNKISDFSHASTHAKNGADPISPAAIGAASTIHASTHANGGADTLTPANIGAAAADHTHTPASIGAESVRLQFTDVTVPTSAWATYTADGDEETALAAAGYTYRAAVALTGVLESMTVNVDPSIDMDDCGAGVWRQNRAYGGGIYLYADGVPTAAFTLLTVMAWKGVV